MTATRADNGAKFTPVLRAATQNLGRPWTRMAPPQEVFYKTFADKTHDSRYDGTFTTVLRANWDLDQANYGTLTHAKNANDSLISVGDAVLSFLDSDVADQSKIKYVTDNSVGGGVMEGRADYVVEPKAISRLKYPILWKLGPYRTDNNGTVGQPNAASTRPFPILKFSELYFAAAEAAVKGAATQPGYSARDLINVIRARAGKWRFSNAKNDYYVADFSKEMTDATPQEITIKYILEELSREYFGEGHRWFDLVRTQMWKELASTYTIAGMNATDVTPQTYTRTINNEHYLRPIPQSQLDAMEMTEEEKAEFQNPGY